MMRVPASECEPPLEGAHRVGERGAKVLPAVIRRINAFPAEGYLEVEG